MIVIEGRAHKPVYLWIQDDAIEIREAFQYAQASPLPGPEALKRHLFLSERAG